jgi:hypothetical protein
MLTGLDEIEDMVSLRSKSTGIANTIFLSTKGYGRHAPRIKIAIDPPDSFVATGKTISKTIHDCRVIGKLAPIEAHRNVLIDAKYFIERHRVTLLAYWDGQIDTEQLIERLK